MMNISVPQKKQIMWTIKNFPYEKKEIEKISLSDIYLEGFNYEGENLVLRGLFKTLEFCKGNIPLEEIVGKGGEKYGGIGLILHGNEGANLTFNHHQLTGAMLYGNSVEGAIFEDNSGLLITTKENAGKGSKGKDNSLQLGLLEHQSMEGAKLYDNSSLRGYFRNEAGGKICFYGISGEGTYFETGTIKEGRFMGKSGKNIIFEKGMKEYLDKITIGPNAGIGRIYSNNIRNRGKHITGRGGANKRRIIPPEFFTTKV